MDTEVLKIGHGKLGLKGEFDKNTNIAFIDRETLLKEVAEFKLFGLTLDKSKKASL